MKNYKRQLELCKSEEERYILEKAMEYQEKLKLENGGSGWNDTTDGFRHVWGSAYLSIKYGDLISHAATTGHELTETYQPKEERKMDEWNNAIGREIAKSLKKEYKDIDKSFQWSQIEDLIAVKTLEKIKNDKVATSTSDTKLQNKNLLFKLNAVKNSSEKKSESIKEKMVRLREEKLAKYTQRLAESPEKKAEREAKHKTLADLKAPQESRVNRVHEMIANNEEKLKEKKLNKKTSGSKNASSKGSGSGRWITVRGRHIFVGD